MDKLLSIDPLQKIHFRTGRELLHKNPFKPAPQIVFFSLPRQPWPGLSNSAEDNQSVVANCQEKPQSTIFTYTDKKEQLTVAEQQVITLMTELEYGRVRTIPLPPNISVVDSYLQRRTQPYLTAYSQDKLRFLPGESGVNCITVGQFQTATAALDDRTMLVTDTLMTCGAFAMRLIQRENQDGINQYFALAHFSDGTDVESLTEYIERLSVNFQIEEIAYTISDLEKIATIRDLLPPTVKEARKPHYHTAEDEYDTAAMIVNKQGGCILRNIDYPSHHGYVYQTGWNWHH